MITAQQIDGQSRSGINDHTVPSGLALARAEQSEKAVHPELVRVSIATRQAIQFGQ